MSHTQRWLGALDIEKGVQVFMKTPRPRASGFINRFISPFRRSLWGSKTTIPASDDRVRRLVVIARPTRSHRAVERLDPRSNGLAGPRPEQREKDNKALFVLCRKYRQQ